MMTMMMMIRILVKMIMKIFLTNGCIRQCADEHLVEKAARNPHQLHSESESLAKLFHFHNFENAPQQKFTIAAIKQPLLNITSSECGDHTVVQNEVFSNA